jgi:3-hydroxyacyl-CoA dehydrogenase
VKPAVFVFESVLEDLELKQHVFADLERYVSTDTILASNTSGLPISRIADNLQHPERVATAHFWNPPHLMPLVEIVKGQQTSATTVDRLRVLLDAAAKRTVVVCKDVPGQLGNRLLHALFREAFHLVQEGVASDQPPQFVRDLVAHGDLGARTGHGLYDWTRRNAGDVLAARDRFIAARLRDARLRDARSQLP